MPYPYSPPAPLNSPPQRPPDPRSSPNTQPSLPPIVPTPPVRPPPGRDSAPVKPSSIPFPLKPSHASKPSKAPGPLTPTSPTGLPFSPSDNLSQKKRVASGDTVKVVTQDDTNSSFHMRASDDEESEFGGLAYAESDVTDDEDPIVNSHPTLHRGPSISSSAYSDDHALEQEPLEIGLDTAVAALLGSPTSTDQVLSPPSVDKVLSPTSPTTPIPRASKPPMRSLTSPTQRDSSALAGGVNRRGGTISGAIGGGSSDKSRRKERLSGESNASGLDKHRETVFTCMRCSKDIEDNRWIQVENGKGVLCGGCWKNMYLPKVREYRLVVLMSWLTIQSEVSAVQPTHREAGRFVLGRPTQREIPPRMLQLPHLPRMHSPAPRSNPYSTGIRNPSPTRPSTSLTESHFATTTITRQTTRSARLRTADSPSRAPAQCHMRATGTIQNTLHANTMRMELAGGVMNVSLTTGRSKGACFASDICGVSLTKTWWTSWTTLEGRPTPAR